MLKLVNEWDKVFPKDEAINHQKEYLNQYAHLEK